MQPNKKCPKCGNEMVPRNKLVGWSMKAVAIADSHQTPDDGDKVIPFECQKCGYIELYNAKYVP